MSARKVRRIFLIIVLAGLVYYDWPILMNMLGVSEKKQTVIYETSAPVNLGDCSDEKFNLGWISDMNVENIARVSLMSTKVGLSLDLSEVGNLTFRKGGIISVGTECSKDKDGNCSNELPYRIHVGQCFAKKQVPILAWDWSGAFNKVTVTENTAGQLRVNIMKDDKSVASLDLAISNPKDSALAEKLNTKSVIDGKNFFKKDKPYNAYVNGIEMTILSLN